MNDVTNQDPDWKATVSAKLQKTWQGVKAASDKALADPTPWAVVTITSLVICTVSAVIGFGGFWGAHIIGGIIVFPLILFVAFGSGQYRLTPDPNAADFAQSLYNGAGWLLMAAQPFFAVLTVVMAGVAVVGIAGWAVSASRWNRQFYRLSPETRDFYYEVLQHPDLLKSWDMETFIEHGVTTKEAIAFFRKEFGDRVFTFDTDFTEKTAEQLEPEARELFTKFDGKLFPKVNYIEAQRFNLQEISNLHRCSEFKEIVVKGRDRVSDEEYFDRLEERNARKKTGDGGNS